MNEGEASTNWPHSLFVTFTPLPNLINEQRDL